jgi:hypothetical protein
MTILQIRTNAPAPVNATDAMNMANQAIGFVGQIVPKLIALVYFAAVIVILWRVFVSWRTKKQLTNMEWCAIAITFGLMR